MSVEPYLALWGLTWLCGALPGSVEPHLALCLSRGARAALGSGPSSGIPGKQECHIPGPAAGIAGTQGPAVIYREFARERSKVRAPTATFPARQV